MADRPANGAKSRRDLILAAIAAAALVVPAAARADGKIPRIGYLSASTPERDRPLLAAFRDGLRARGHVVGRTVLIERRFADGKYARLPALAAELVALKVDVIVGSGPVPRVVKQATRTIPIVMRTSNPVGTGLAKSLSRPGGNVTGLATFSARLAGKRLEILKEVVPSMRRVAVLHLPTGSHPRQLKALREAAPALGVALAPVAVKVRQPGALERAFLAVARENPGGLIVFAASYFETHRKEILEFAAARRIPGIYAYENWPKTGGLMSYGTDVPALYRRMAVYVDKILKGANPAELPIEQPREFELVINLRVAQALGLTVPRATLLRASQLVE